MFKRIVGINEYLIEPHDMGAPRHFRDHGAIISDPGFFYGSGLEKTSGNAFMDKFLI